VLAYDLPAYRYLGDAIQSVPLGETDMFVAEASRLLVDNKRLSAAHAALENAGDRLPQWAEILAAELGALRRFMKTLRRTPQAPTFSVDYGPADTETLATSAAKLRLGDSSSVMA